MHGIAPFAIDVPAEVLDDLAWRLRRARWPARLLLAGGEDAGRLLALERLLTRWRDGFDWREQERLLNALPQHRVTVGGVVLHVVWARSERPGARPLLLVNGWPSSFVEYRDVVAALTAPDAGPTFDVVIPSRPGYGFSEPALDRPGCDDVAADLFARLMTELLGYDRFLIHGDDFGGSIASRLAWRHPSRVEALHVTEWLEPAMPDPSSLTADEGAYLDALAAWREAEARLRPHRRDAAADARPGPRRLPARPALVDRRRVPQLDGPRRGRRPALRRRLPVDHRDALLGDPDHDDVDAALRRGGRRARAGRAD